MGKRVSKGQLWADAEAAGEDYAEFWTNCQGCSGKIEVCSTAQKWGSQMAEDIRERLTQHKAHCGCRWVANEFNDMKIDTKVWKDNIP